MLNKKIDNLERTGVFNDLELETLKKQRLHLKDEISIMKDKQKRYQEDND